MPKIRLIVTEDIEVPEGTKIVLAPTGVISRLQLPDGTEIKPWIVYEDVAKEADLSHDDLIQMEVDTGLDYQISITPPSPQIAAPQDPVDEDVDLEYIQPERLPAY